MENTSLLHIPSTQLDLFFAIFRWFTTSLSLFSNGLLLVVIYLSPSSHLGHYRVLLAIFAICNVVTSVMHDIYQPIVHLTSNGLYAISRRAGKLVYFGVSLDIPIALTFAATFNQTFLILAFHYVYRYKTVTRLLRSSYTDGWAFRKWFAVGVAVYILYISSVLGVVSIGYLPDEWTRMHAPVELLYLYDIDFRNPNTGYFCMMPLRKCVGSDALCWHWPTIAAMCAEIALFGVTAGVIASCIYQTRSAFRSASNFMTPKTKKMQRDLFNALLMQTVIPFLCSYAPLCAIILIPPMSGADLGNTGTLIYSAMTIFPAIDSFFVLYFIEQFRLTLKRLFRLPCSGSRIDASSTDRHDSTTGAVVNPYNISFEISRV